MNYFLKLFIVCVLLVSDESVEVYYANKVGFKVIIPYETFERKDSLFIEVGGIKYGKIIKIIKCKNGKYIGPLGELNKGDKCWHFKYYPFDREIKIKKKVIQSPAILQQRIHIFELNQKQLNKNENITSVNDMFQKRFPNFSSYEEYLKQ